MAAATGSGELEDLMQDTVRFIGSVTNGIWTAGTSVVKDMLLMDDYEEKQEGGKSMSEEWGMGNDLKKPFEDLEMLVRMTMYLYIIRGHLCH